MLKSFVSSRKSVALDLTTKKAAITSEVQRMMIKLASDGKLEDGKGDIRGKIYWLCITLRHFQASTCVVDGVRIVHVKKLIRGRGRISMHNPHSLVRKQQKIIFSSTYNEVCWSLASCEKEWLGCSQVA
jgi:hypothetical protein